MYESADEIDVSKLPDTFVLKGTHGSAFNLICVDKSAVNWNQAFSTMNQWLKTDYFIKGREWVYKDLKPRIVCENYLVDKKTEQLMDYKIFCFDGEPEFIFLVSDRNDGIEFDFYDTDWKRIPVSQKKPNSLNIFPKPKELDQLLDLSRKLSEGFPHVRVDFYICNEKIVFGELTFFHFNGYERFTPNKYDEIFGEYINLPEVRYQ